MDQPIFILSAGGRTGSTLVQRLFLSTKQALIWGEHKGLLVSGLGEMLRGIKKWLAAEGRGQLELFEKSGHQAFIPNVNPNLQAFLSASRQFFDESLGKEALRRGYPRWGFKEVRYGCQEALFLQELYPDASFVLLFRNPRDCLRSVKSTSWYNKDFGRNPRTFLNAWSRLSRDLLTASTQLRRSCIVRYEELIEDHERHIELLSHTSGIRLDLFDRSVFAKRLSGSMWSPRKLDSADIAALGSPELQHTAVKLGYSLCDEFPPGLTPAGGPPDHHSDRLVNSIFASGSRAAGGVERSFFGVGNLLAKALRAAGIILSSGEKPPSSLHRNPGRMNESDPV